MTNHSDWPNLLLQLLSVANLNLKGRHFDFAPPVVREVWDAIPEEDRSVEKLCSTLQEYGFLEDSLTIRRQAAIADPNTHLPGLAYALHLIGLESLRSGREAEGKWSIEESLSIYRRLATSRRQSFLAHVGHLSMQLGNIHLDVSFDFDMAKLAFAEAQVIFEELELATPGRFQSDVDAAKSSLAEATQRQRGMAAAAHELEIKKGSNEDATRAHRIYLETQTLYNRISQQEAGDYNPALRRPLPTLDECLAGRSHWDFVKDQYNRSIELHRELIRASPQPEMYFGQLASTLQYLSAVHRKLLEFPAAEGCSAEATRLYRLFAIALPSIAVESRSRAASALAEVGSIRRERGDFRGAIEAQREAVTLVRHCIAKEPGRRWELTTQLTALANSHLANGDTVAARAAFAESISLHRELSQEHPLLHGAPFAIALSNFATLLTELREFDEAETLLNEAISILRAKGDRTMRALAGALNNLGNLRLHQHKLAAAGVALEETIEIKRELAAMGPVGYRNDLASSLNNLANVYRSDRRFDEAGALIEEALTIQRTLALFEPVTFRAPLAVSLLNSGTILHQLGRIETAERGYREALSILQELSADHRAAYLAQTVRTLSNLGSLLLDKRDIPGSRETLDRALPLGRELAAANPEIGRPRLAATLTNLGDTASAEGDLELAGQHYEESCRLWLDTGNGRIDAARPLVNFVRAIIDHQGDLHVAGKTAARAIGLLESGLDSLGLAEQSRRDKFKGTVEDAYEILIASYAASSDPRLHRQLPLLFEALRRVELLSNTVEEVKSPTLEWMEQVERNSGPLAAYLNENRAAVLWMHQSTHGILFALLRPGHTVRIEATTTKAIQAFALLQARISRSGSALAEGTQVHGLLPPSMQSLLADPEIETVFLSPCWKSMHYPIEIVVSNRTYAGLGKLFVRTHGLQEIATAMRRNPSGAKALLINPHYSGEHRLADSELASESLRGLLEREGNWIINQPEPTVGHSRVISILSNIGVRLVNFNGHGNESEVVLGDGSTLHWNDLLREKLVGAPLVHLDCCKAGFDHGKGGGRFEGMAVAALRAGASAVLASSLPVYDGSARLFSERLYAALLDPVDPASLCTAILLARNEVYAQHGPHVRHWAAHVPWGNPAIRLR